MEIAQVNIVGNCVWSRRQKRGRNACGGEDPSMWLWLCALLTVTSCVLAAPATKSVDLLMPQVQPREPDTYLCRSMDVAMLKPYITEFIPNANKDIAHHILLYGCEEPGSRQEVWNCGEMAQKSSDYEAGPVCARGSKIIYAWAMDAPSLTLPKDVAFKVGGDSGIKTLAMQVHYKNVTSFLPPQNKKDSSGITLVTTDQPKGRLAGVYLMVTGGVIPAGQTEYLETACPYPDKNVEIHPFAFRTHTHKLGQVVSGYRVRDGQWTEIGRKSPRKPQMFYNVTTPGITVRSGDILAARCTMKNNLNHDVSIGATQNDEMCNFYIMFYVEGNRNFSGDTCFRPGGPAWYLKDYPDQVALNLPAMPDTASVVPGTSKVILPTTPGARQELKEPQEELEESSEDEEEDYEEKDSLVMDDLLDDYLSHLAPKDVNELVSEVMGEQDQPYQPVPRYPASVLRGNRRYNPYYYSQDTQ